MSVTVKDALSLPSLRSAKVVAGEQGLSRIVSGVTVQEYSANDELLCNFVQANAAYLNNELIITCFAGTKDDPAAQANALRNYAEHGESGMIVFYLGVVMERLDPLVLRTADELNFPLIVMPEGRMDLRYSDVLTEIMELVFRDREGSTDLSADIIEQMSRLPRSQQTADTVLAMLSQRLQAGLALTDERGAPLSEALWPRTSESILATLTPKYRAAEPYLPVVYAPVPASMLWHVPVRTDTTQLHLYILDSSARINTKLARQSADTVRLCMEIWSRRQGVPLGSELLHAILNDEPVKMRQLAKVLHVDVESIHTMWFLRTAEAGRHIPETAVDEAYGLLRGLSDTVLIDMCSTGSGERDGLTMCFRKPDNIRRLAEAAEQLCETLSERFGQELILTMNNYGRSTADVRIFYRLWLESFESVRKIYPARRIFLDSDFEFVRLCEDAVRLGEASIRRATGILTAIEENPNAQEYLNTLEVYLLDCGMDKQLTADTMNFHKNTIKYRVAQIEEMLGCSIGKMPASAMLARAAAIRRLLKN